MINTELSGYSGAWKDTWAWRVHRHQERFVSFIITWALCRDTTFNR